MKVPSSLQCLGPTVYPEVPDGGWGWVVAMAFFLVEACSYGVVKSLGVFLQDLIEEFGESTSRVSWVISICVFVLTVTAPLSIILSNRFGSRPVVMTGGLLMCLGTISSAFVNSINEMYVTIGIVSGLGYCLAFLPTVTILAQYFSKRRTLVTSVASSGESFAIFAFAPAFTALKERIGWRYCLVVLGVFQTSVIGCGLLLRPIIIKPDSVMEDKGSDKESLPLKQLDSVCKKRNKQSRKTISSGVSLGSEDSGVTSLSNSNTDLQTARAEGKPLTASEVKDKEWQEPTLSTSSGQVQEKGQGDDVIVEAGPPKPSKNKILDFSMLKDCAFIWYSLFGLFANMGFFAPQLYIIELSKSRGVEPSRAPYMLSVMAVAEIFSRLSFGTVLNKLPFRKTLVLLGCVIVICLSLLVFPNVWGFWGLAVCCAIFGYFLGTVGSTHIPMLAEEDVVGVEMMTSCVGVYMFIQSFSGLAGPPLGGVLVDATQNYGAAFYACAVGLFLSAISLAMVGPAKSGMCQRKCRCKETGAKEEEKMSQDEQL